MHTSSMRAVAAGLVVAAAATPLALPGPAAAQDGPEATTWGVVPATEDGPDGRAAFDYKLDPGAELTDHVAVSNHSAEEITVAVYASDAFTTPDGGFDLLPAAEPPTGVGSWITLDRPELTIPARSRMHVPFDLSVPAEATPGDHAGGLVASLTSAGADRGGEQVQVEHRVGARIYLRVTGELQPRLTIERIDAQYEGSWNPFAGGDLTATYTIRNTGNVRLAGTPRLAVAGPFGIGRRSLDAEPLPEILPGDALTTTARWKGLAPLLRLNTTVEPRPAGVDGQQLDPAPAAGSRSVAVWAVPWAQGLLLLAAVAALVWWRWLRRHRKRRFAAAVTAAVREAVHAGSKATEAPQPEGEPT